jgi:hypothetical protein
MSHQCLALLMFFKLSSMLDLNHLLISSSKPIFILPNLLLVLWQIIPCHFLACSGLCSVNYIDILAIE